MDTRTTVAEKGFGFGVALFSNHGGGVINPVILKRGGKIGEVKAQDKFVAEIALLNTASTFIVFTVSGKGENRRITAVAPDTKGQLRKKFSVAEYPDGTLRTNYTEALRIVEIQSNGSWIQYEVGIAIQGTNAYLVKQPIYSGTYYRDANGQAVCPNWDIGKNKRWPELTNHIKQAIATAKINLTALPTNPLPNPNTPKTLPKGNYGRVLFFNDLQGYGAVTDAVGKQHYVSRKHIISGTNGELMCLNGGSLVKWESVHYNQNSAHAFKSELVGITSLA